MSAAAEHAQALNETASVASVAPAVAQTAPTTSGDVRTPLVEPPAAIAPPPAVSDTASVPPPPSLGKLRINGPLRKPCPKFFKLSNCYEPKGK